MEFGTTELDASFDNDGAIESYEPEPGYYDTFKASVQNFTSVSLSSSEANYFKDERDTQKEQWIKSNSKDAPLYERIAGIDKNIIEKLDALYEDGEYDQIKKWHSSTNSSMVNIGGIGVGEDYLRFRDLQSEMGLTNTSDIINNAKTKAQEDYYKSAEVLKKSDHWSAELLGTMWGAMHDPVTLLTLPVGTWKTGGTVLANASKAALEEMKIEAMAQTVIAPTVAGHKQELGIKTSIAQESLNAVVAIGSAGLIRGTGSAVFDLTSDGIKALKLKDPDLGSEYEQMVKSQATEDVSEHIQNMHRTEFDEYGVDVIDNPNEAGKKINESPPLYEIEPDIIDTAKVTTSEKKIDPMDYEVLVGINEAGEKEMKSYRQMSEEIDLEAQYIQKAKECFL